VIIFNAGRILWAVAIVMLLSCQMTSAYGSDAQAGQKVQLRLILSGTSTRSSDGGKLNPYSLQAEAVGGCTVVHSDDRHENRAPSDGEKYEVHQDIICPDGIQNQKDQILKYSVNYENSKNGDKFRIQYGPNIFANEGRIYVLRENTNKSSITQTFLIKNLGNTFLDGIAIGEKTSYKDKNGQYFIDLMLPLDGERRILNFTSTVSKSCEGKVKITDAISKNGKTGVIELEDSNCTGIFLDKFSNKMLIKSEDCFASTNDNVLLCLKKNPVEVQFKDKGEVRIWTGDLSNIRNKRTPPTIRWEELTVQKEPVGEDRSAKPTPPVDVVFDLSADALPPGFRLQISSVPGCLLKEDKYLEAGQKIRLHCQSNPDKLNVGSGSLLGAEARLTRLDPVDGVEQRRLEINQLFNSFRWSMLPADVKGGVAIVADGQSAVTLNPGGTVQLSGRDFINKSVKVQSATLDSCYAQAELHVDPAPGVDGRHTVTFKLDSLPCVFVRFPKPEKWTEIVQRDQTQICRPLPDGVLCPKQPPGDIQFKRTDDGTISTLSRATIAASTTTGGVIAEIDLPTPPAAPRPSYTLQLVLEGLPPGTKGLTIRDAPVGCDAQSSGAGPANEFSFVCQQVPARKNANVSGMFRGAIEIVPKPVTGTARQFKAMVNAGTLVGKFQVSNRLSDQSLVPENFGPDGTVELRADLIANGKIKVWSTILPSCKGDARLTLGSSADGAVIVESPVALPCVKIVVPDKYPMPMQAPNGCQKIEKGFLCPDTADVMVNPGPGWRVVKLPANKLKVKGPEAVFAQVVLNPEQIVVDLDPVLRQMEGIRPSCGEKPAITGAVLARGTCPGGFPPGAGGVLAPTLADWKESGTPDTICLNFSGDATSPVAVKLGKTLGGNILERLRAGLTYPIRVDGRPPNSLHDLHIYAERSCKPESETGEVAFEQGSYNKLQVSACSAMRIMWGSQPQSSCVPGNLVGNTVVFTLDPIPSPEKRVFVLVDNSQSLYADRDEAFEIVRAWARDFQGRVSSGAAANVELLLSNGKGDLDRLVKFDEWRSVGSTGNGRSSLDIKLDRLSFNAGNGEAADIFEAVKGAPEVGGRFDRLLLITGRMPPPDDRGEITVAGLIHRRNVIILASDKICAAWRSWSEAINCQPIAALSANIVSP
jgi:hypothetical protein